MIAFIAGFFAGSFCAVAILGFMAVVAEDHELEDQARRKGDQDRKAVKEIEDWYRSCS